MNAQGTLIATKRMWCKGCPDLIMPGDDYVETGDDDAPTCHVECQGREWLDGEGVFYEFDEEDREL